MREIVVDAVKLPDVPVMVTMTLPVTAVAPAVKVSVLVPVVLAGLKDAVTPLGKPEADSATVPLKPFSGVIAMVLKP